MIKFALETLRETNHLFDVFMILLSEREIDIYELIRLLYAVTRMLLR